MHYISVSFSKFLFFFLLHLSFVFPSSYLKSNLFISIQCFLHFLFIFISFFSFFFLLLLLLPPSVYSFSSLKLSQWDTSSKFSISIYIIFHASIFHFFAERFWREKNKKKMKEEIQLVECFGMFCIAWTLSFRAQNIGDTQTLNKFYNICHIWIANYSHSTHNRIYIYIFGCVCVCVHRCCRLQANLSVTAYKYASQYRHSNTIHYYSLFLYLFIFKVQKISSFYKIFNGFLISLFGEWAFSSIHILSVYHLNSTLWIFHVSFMYQFS